MWFLILAGCIAFCAGVLFLFSPKTLQQLGNKINTAVNRISFPIDERIYKLRIGVGISLILVAAMLFFVAYYLIKKYTL